MAMCLLWGLVSANFTKQPGAIMNMDDNVISSLYAAWVKSGPYDIGNTTFSALSPLMFSKDKKAIVAKTSAIQECPMSMSNGCLMRATPLAIWCSNLNSSNVHKVVKSDVEMTHPLRTC